MKRFSILGGGPLGLSAAETLVTRGHQVHLIDSGYSLGGLATYHRFDDMLIDRFYHFYYLNDHAEAEAFIKKTGVTPEITWQKIRSSTFQDGKFYDFDSPLEVLKLAGFSFFRVLFTLLRLKLFSPSGSLDAVSAAAWSKAAFGEKFAQKIWIPLLKDKFGDAHELISALWLATRIKRHLSTKTGIPPKCKFGYLEGTYKESFEAVIRKLEQNGGKVRYRSKINSIEIEDDKIASLKINNSETLEFDVDDVVLSALPLVSLKSVVHDDTRFEYLNIFNAAGIVQLTLSLDAKLSNDYWTTVTDPTIPFKVVIQQNRLSPRGKHEIVYLSKYYYSKSGHFDATDDEIKLSFWEGLKKMFPHLRESNLIQCEVTRSMIAAPIPAIGMTSKLPSYKTPIRNFYHGALEHIYPEDRGVGNSIRIGRELALCAIEGTQHQAD